MLRFFTAGESHGQGLVVIVDGLPAGLEITAEEVRSELARRRLGFGRGPRMRFEQDQVTLLGGVRHGRTIGAPVAITIANMEWPKWEVEMSPAPGHTAKPLTAPRPGHADLAGMMKYGLEDARDVLERASARETAARVAAGSLAKKLLAKGGVPRGFKTPLVTEQVQEMPEFAQVVAQSAKAIGVDIALTVEAQNKYYGSAVFGKSDWLDGEMSLVDYGARSVPNVFLEAPLQSINAKTGQGSWNAARFNDPTYNTLSRQYIAAVDLSVQRRIAKQIELLLLDETPIIYAYFYNYLSATQKNVKGVYPTAQGQFFLWNASKS